MSGKLIAILALVAILLSTVAGVGPAMAATGNPVLSNEIRASISGTPVSGPEVVAFDMVGSASQNLTSFVNNAPAFSSAADGFDKYRRGVSPSIPFAVLDDSLSVYPADNLGIIDETNTDEFFGATDTENGDNSGPVTAEWTFDVDGYDNLELSIDMGAMGDFEATGDFFEWTVAIDGGASQTAFASTVDEAVSQDYTLAGGNIFTLSDPMLVDGVLLSNILQTFSKSITGSGSELVLTLTLQTDGGSEAMAFQNIVISGVSGGANVPPTVVSTDPADSAEYINVDANIEIVFSEAVMTTGAWFEFTCDSTTVPAVASGGPTSYTLDPVSDLPSTSACTVTIMASQVTDQGDPPLNMEEDYSFGFTTTSLCGDPATFIHEVQGQADVSPLVGQVVTVEGVVVGDFQNNASADNGDLDGFYIQEENGDADTNALTSEGVFVFGAGFGVDVAVGDRVRVTGVASEFFNRTQIASPAVVLVCDSGNSVMPTELSLPVTSLDDFEAYESMLVTFPQELHISEYFNFDRFGEIVLTTDRQFQPTAIYEPGSPEAALLAVTNSLSRITLDDGRDSSNPDPALHPNGSVFDLVNLFRGGDTVQNVTGVLDYNFGLYKVQPTQGADFTSVNPRTDLPDDVGGNLRVASFNVLNYFTTLDDGVNDICGPAGDQECRGADTAEEFTRQRDKIIAALTAIDADVVGLIEIENHPGDVPTADLVSGLNDVLGPGTYEYIATGAIGTDAIRQALIYRPATVSLVGDFAVLDDPAFTDPLGYGEPKSRPALAQTFMGNTTGGVFTVVVNHLKSKGTACDNPVDDDPQQGNCNLTRMLGAQALVNWLATDPTDSGDEDFLIIGDLNAYDKEDPIDALLAGGYTDLVYQFQGEFAYSYVFDGQLGYLDHALAGADLMDEVAGTTVWHINADEPDLIDYDMSYKQDAQDALYAPDAYRSSDHDPVIVGLSVCDDEVAPTVDVSIAPDTLWPPNHKYVDVVATVVATDNFDPNPTVTLASVMSNEPDSGMDDEDLPDDIVIVDDYTFQLRAERWDEGDGRVYIITYEATDACGNSTIASATVSVPHDQGKKNK